MIIVVLMLLILNCGFFLFIMWIVDLFIMWGMIKFLKVFRFKDVKGYLMRIIFVFRCLNVVLFFFLWGNIGIINRMNIVIFEFIFYFDILWRKYLLIVNIIIVILIYFFLFILLYVVVFLLIVWSSLRIMNFI